MAIARDRILYCDEYLLAVNKLAGELVVRGKGPVGKLPLLDFLRKEFPGIRAVHRLDFETSGVVIFARTGAVLQEILNKKFVQWKKVYWVLVKGEPKREGSISVAVPARRLRSGMQTGDLVPAETRYRVLEVFGEAALVEAEMVTGRHHQLRRHFAAISHPLVLDDLYGDRSFNREFTQKYGYHRFFLHAAHLSFPHPVTGKILTIGAPLPRAFEECIEKLRGN